LIDGRNPGIVRRQGWGTMRPLVGLFALAVALLVSGCSSASKCPTPIHYSDATLMKIEKAREALPKGSVLEQVLEDYENERDDLRHCQ
jgi:hypothetical protein